MIDLKRCDVLSKMDDPQFDTRALAVAASVAGLTPIQKAETEIDDLFETEKFSTAPLSKINAGRESIIDSNNMSKKIKALMKAIQNPETSDAGKIKVCDFICNKLCDIYHIPLEKREILVGELTNVVFNAESMPVPLRLFYLKFRNETVPYPVSVNLFHDGVRDKMSVVPYFQILKYILHTNMDLRRDEHCTEVLDEFEQLFSNEDVSIYTKMEIADVFLLNNRTERGHEMLDTLRELEFQLVLNPNDANNAALYQRVMTVYGDSQNVHSTDLNESVLKACVHLMELEQPNGFDADVVKEILYKVAPEQREHIDTVMERIEIDTSRFKCGDNMFGLYDVFSSLWTWITKHPSKEELYGRLVEEMVAMAKYCTTGHVSRFINVIQGYSDDEGLHVRISDEQQIRAVVGHYLDTVMMNATEDVTDAMIGDDQTAFYEFIESRMNDRIPQLLEEYGENQEHIITAVKAYSRWDYWSILDSTIKCEPRPSAELIVDDSCIEVYPCVHDCELEGKKFQWDGLQIHAWYVENNKEVPVHFAEYTADWTLGLEPVVEEPAVQTTPPEPVQKPEQYPDKDVSSTKPKVAQMPALELVTEEPIGELDSVRMDSESNEESESQSSTGSKRKWCTIM